MLTFDNVDYFTGTLNEFTEDIFNNRTFSPSNKLIITHINLRNYYYLNKYYVLKEWIRKNCIVVLDGIGLKIGFFFKGLGPVKDLNGTDLFPLFMNKFKNSGERIFLMGSEEHVINNAARNIKDCYSGINICGFNPGYYDSAEELNIIKKINDSRADILLIGMGFPIQEEFVLKHNKKLNVSLIWFVGGLFDYVSGNKPRAPYFLRKIRLEWLFRLFLEPGRMLYRNTVCAFGAYLHILNHH